jgi:hypothetical protein
MSVRIYEAYRLKRGHDVWKTIARLRKRAIRNAKQITAQLYESLLADSEGRAELRKMLADPIAKIDYMTAAKWLRTRQRQADPFFTPNAELRLNWTGRRWLIRPHAYGFLSGALVGVRRAPELEDYHYQTASDKPQHISTAAWVARGRTWNRLFDEHDRLTKNEVVVPIATPRDWATIDPAVELLLAAKRKAR